jgi:hypothetical protein
LRAQLYPKKIPCTSKLVGVGVHVPSNEKSCGDADVIYLWTLDTVC